MGIFDTFFGKKEESNKKLKWNQLTASNQLDTIVENSKILTQVIFKHSTRCGISSSVLKRFENQFDTSKEVELYFLDLISYRDISSEIATRFDVVHQSPQMLIVKNGVVETYASHYDILELDAF